LELITILSPLSSSARQTEEGKYRIETEKKCVICGNKEIFFLATLWPLGMYVTCVPNMALAYVKIILNETFL